MEIEMSSDGELLELRLQGRLDNEGAAHFAEYLDEVIRLGWYRVMVRLEGVHYMSSAGIGKLVAARKELTALKGFFGICDLQPDVRQVLEQTRLLKLLEVDPQSAFPDTPAGAMTCLSTVRIASHDDVDLQIFELRDDAQTTSTAREMTCRLIGKPTPPGDPAFSATESWGTRFSQTSLGIGLGALGTDFASCQEQFGEFLALAGCVGQSPLLSNALPDYSVPLGDFFPEVQVCYGACCTGAFSCQIRFSISENSALKAIPLSKILQLAMQTLDYEQAAAVVLGECSGLIGTQLRKSPASDGNGSPNRSPQFTFPEIRDWLSFSGERVHSRSLALAGGIVNSKRASCSESLLPFLRPLNRDGNLLGHFHAAVFPYRPLKRRTLSLEDAVKELFDSGTLQNVMHLLRDDRPIRGGGESEYVSGVCWIAPLRTEVTTEDSQ